MVFFIVVCHYLLSITVRPPVRPVLPLRPCEAITLVGRRSLAFPRELGRERTPTRRAVFFIVSWPVLPSGTVSPPASPDRCPLKKGSIYPVLKRRVFLLRDIHIIELLPAVVWLAQLPKRATPAGVKCHGSVYDGASAYAPVGIIQVHGCHVFGIGTSIVQVEHYGRSPRSMRGGYREKFKLYSCHDSLGLGV
jgi:hypothetical protein